MENKKIWLHGGKNWILRGNKGSDTWANAWCSIKTKLTHLPNINIQVIVNSSQDWQQRRITAFSIEDLLQVFWIFYGVAEKRKMQRFQKGINNKSSVHLSVAAVETQFNPSITSNPLFYLTYEGILKGEISGWFTRRLTCWWIDLVSAESDWRMSFHLYQNSLQSIRKCCSRAWEQELRMLVGKV